MLVTNLFLKKASVCGERMQAKYILVFSEKNREFSGEPIVRVQ